MNVTGRWCEAEFKIVRRLLCFATTAKQVDASQLAGLVTQRLCSSLLVDTRHVAGITRDSASVNGAACRLLKANPFTSALDMMCFSHTLSNAGERIELVAPTTPDLPYATRPEISVGRESRFAPLGTPH